MVSKKIIIPISLILLLILLQPKKTSDLDPVNEAKIKSLHPKIREAARKFINDAADQGIILRITSGYRTYAEQDKLYAQGRTAPGAIVTRAKGGYSNHNFALAFDVVPLLNGQPNWNSTEWNKIGQIGKNNGFSWGGDWSGFVDKPHFQNMFGYSLAQLRQKVSNGDMTDNFVNL